MAWFRSLLGLPINGLALASLTVASCPCETEPHLDDGGSDCRRALGRNRTGESEIVVTYPSYYMASGSSPPARLLVIDSFCLSEEVSYVLQS